MFWNFVGVGSGRDKEIISKVAQKVKSLREAGDLTQEQLYNDLEIHVGRLESMKVNPTNGTIHRLCQYFGISLADFFEDFH